MSHFLDIGDMAIKATVEVPDCKELNAHWEKRKIIMHNIKCHRATKKNKAE